MTTGLRDRIYRTEGVVIGRFDLGEADRIFTILTPGRGKIRAIAKGVRRPRSRMAPHLEYFAQSALLLAKGRDLDVITSAETVEGHPRLRTDLALLGDASYVAEMLNRLTEDGQELPAAYDLLVRTLTLLEEGIRPFLVLRYFDLALLTLLGYRPQLYRCVHCESELLAEPNALSAQLGGMLCPRCRTTDVTAQVIGVNGQKVIRMLDREGLASAVTLRFDDPTRFEIERALSGFIRHLLDRDLATPRVVRAIQEGLGSAYSAGS